MSDNYNEPNSAGSDVSDEDIEKMLEVLENFGDSQEGRMKIQTSETVAAGETATQYHYGRCDIGSPFAKGTPFDVNDSCN